MPGAFAGNLEIPALMDDRLDKDACWLVAFEPCPAIQRNYKLV